MSGSLMSRSVGLPAGMLEATSISTGSCANMPAMAGDHLHPGNAEDRQSLLAGTVDREHGDAVERPVGASLQLLDRQDPDARGRLGEGARDGVGEEVALVEVHAEAERDRVAHGDLRRLGGGGEGAAVVELGLLANGESGERCSLSEPMSS